MKSVDSFLQQGDLSLVISVVLEQAPDQRADGNAGIGRWIALVPDPANQVNRVEVVNRALQILLCSSEIILCPTPRRLASSGFRTRPILRR